MTFTDLKTYFQANRDRFADLAWDDPHQLSPAQLRAVGPALRALQRGAARPSALALASPPGAADYLAATQLLRQEQASHAQTLGRFMDQQGIARPKPRRLAALGRWLGEGHLARVRLPAEVVATVCYRALFNATYSGLLQQICRRLVLDKELHLVHYCLAGRLAAPQRNWLAAWGWRQLCRVLLVGVALGSYARCGRALRAGGYGLLRFCAAVFAEYARAEQQLQPASLLVVRGGPVGPAGAWQWPSQQAPSAC